MDVPIRATFAFFFLWGLTRALGKRELSQLSAFELVLLITVGDLVQQGVTQEDYSVTGAVLATGTVALWVLVFAYLSFRSGRARRAIEGDPVLIVRDGEPLVAALRVERLTVDEVLEGAREQGIARLDQVQYAFLEPDGRFSFLTEDHERHPQDERKDV
ncbi:MAG: DUF421 domain-containing protein [Acidimicrobiales bacterium]